MVTELAGKTVAVLGMGTMGEAICVGLGGAGLELVGTTRRAETADRARERLDAAGVAVRFAPTNAEAVRGCDAVVLCVKPQTLDGVLREIAPALPPAAVVVSIAAGKRTPAISRALGARNTAVVRAMPNTPAVIGCGMTVLVAGEHAGANDVALAAALFRRVGAVEEVENENLMDAVTGLSGSGPAYIYTVIEALTEAGVKVGLPRRVAAALAAQTTLGASRMVQERAEHPAMLRDAVCTPAGCTVDGLMELEKGGIRVTLIKAVEKSTRRAAALGSSAGDA